MTDKNTIDKRQARCTFNRAMTCGKEPMQERLAGLIRGYKPLLRR